MIKKNSIDSTKEAKVERDHDWSSNDDSSLEQRHWDNLFNGGYILGSSNTDSMSIN